MMTLQYILIGIAIGFGITLGLIFSLSMIVLLLVRSKRKKQQTYNEKALLSAFVNYRGKLLEGERYSEMGEVERIITGLKTNEIIDAVNAYEIKKKSSLVLREDGGDQIFNFVDKYTVIGKKY